MTKHAQLFARRANRPLKKSRNSTRKLSNDQPTFAWEPCHFLKDITARNRILSCWKKVFFPPPFCQLLLHKQRQRQMCLHHVPQITIAELFLSFTIWLSILLFLSASNLILYLLGSRSSNYLQRYDCHFLLNLNAEMRPNVNYLHYEDTVNTFTDKLFSFLRQRWYSLQISI